MGDTQTYRKLAEAIIVERSLASVPTDVLRGAALEFLAIVKERTSRRWKSGTNPDGSDCWVDVEVVDTEVDGDYTLVRDGHGEWLVDPEDLSRA